MDAGCDVQHRRDAFAAGFYYKPYVQPRRGAVIGDEAYFTLRWGNPVVKYNWSKNHISLIDPPTKCVYNVGVKKKSVDKVALMVMEDSSLGFACVEGSSLHLWSRKVNAEGDAEWAWCRAIQLESIIPVANSDDKPFVVGSAEGVGVIFVSTGAGLFTIKLDSGLVKKVAESGVYFSVLPYMSFYTPVYDIGKQNMIFVMRFNLLRSTTKH
uniref:F-box associated domain-containing protein n=1 Tax=Aegilops tauschii TaxID=37682 RepID=R7W8I1_AEGTA